MPLKLDHFFAFFSYGGNSTVAGQHPFIRRWFSETILKMKEDERVGEIWQQDYSDTPIPMMRNRAVAEARAAKADVLFMLDSDNIPDLEGSPFWETSFDFLWKHWPRGPVVIAAPYTGPPPDENIFVFKWANFETGTPDYDIKIEQYTREEAAGMAGIHPCVATGTGVMFLDLRLFDYLPHPYFDYEYEKDGPPCSHCHQRIPGPRTHKASTEDCFGTRNMTLIASEKLGYDPVFCNWDSWAGHGKVKITGKPKLVTTDMVGYHYKKGLEMNRASNEKLVFLRGDNGHAFEKGEKLENDLRQHQGVDGHREILPEASGGHRLLQSGQS